MGIVTRELPLYLRTRTAFRGHRLPVRRDRGGRLPSPVISCRGIRRTASTGHGRTRIASSRPETVYAYEVFREGQTSTSTSPAARAAAPLPRGCATFNP
ncbi:MAG: hypothetical protein ACLSVD_12205 [Eggerthellaceae bacterium]